MNCQFEQALDIFESSYMVAAGDHHLFVAQRASILISGGQR
jgi:hypothetical protein